MSRESLGLLIRKTRKEKDLSLRDMKDRLGDLDVKMSIVTILILKMVDTKRLDKI